MDLQDKVPWTGTPGLKHGHLSKTNPAFAAVENQIEAFLGTIWSRPTVEECTTAWTNLPEALFVDSQDLRKKITVEKRHVPVRDGWVAGKHETEEAMNVHLAAEAGVIVVSVAYRLAPKFPFPHGLNDSFDVLSWCKTHSSELGIDPEKIILAGSSAGANLAAALSLKTRDDNLTGIIAQVLNCPITCHPMHLPKDKYELQSPDQNGCAPVMDTPKIIWCWAQYLPGAEPDAYASPLLAKSFANLPPTLIQIPGLDPLRDEQFAYAEALQRAGVPATVKVFPGLPHGFFAIAELQEAREHLENVVGFVKEVTTGR